MRPWPRFPATLTRRLSTAIRLTNPRPFGAGQDGTAGLTVATTCCFRHSSRLRDSSPLRRFRSRVSITMARTRPTSLIGAFKGAVRAFRRPLCPTSTPLRIPPHPHTPRLPSRTWQSRQAQSCHGAPHTDTNELSLGRSEHIVRQHRPVSPACVSHRSIVSCPPIHARRHQGRERGGRKEICASTSTSKSRLFER